MSLHVSTGEAARKRNKLASVKFVAQQPMDTKDAFVDVQQKALAGLSPEVSKMFVREESVELWRALQAAVKNGFNLSVGGPPGTGKSTEVWAWVLWTAIEKKIKVTWFHFCKRCTIKVLVDGATCTITSGYVANIDEILTSEGAMLVIDGITKSNSVPISCACYDWRQRDEDNRRYVLVSSMSVTVALEQDIQTKIESFTVGSWTLEQYERACENKEFFEEVKSNLRCPGFKAVDEKHELLLSKYDYAGGCARWMFDFSYIRWKGDITTYLGSVGNYELLYYEGGGDATADAVNHLRGVTVLTTDGFQEKKHFFISKYAAAELAKKCDDKRKFLVASYKKAAETQNPAFRGWIFEFDIDYQLHHACDHKTELVLQIRSAADANVHNEERRRVSRYMEFASESDLVTPIRELPGDDVLWAKPTFWCPKAFDFLCVWKQNEKLYMSVANASHAKEHSVLLDEVNTLATTLGNSNCIIEGIRFDFLVPQCGPFRVSGIQGRLCGWKNLTGTQWPNGVNANTYLHGGFIIVADVPLTSK
jgi:hypothetical protein